MKNPMMNDEAIGTEELNLNANDLKEFGITAEALNDIPCDDYDDADFGQD